MEIWWSAFRLNTPSPQKASSEVHDDATEHTDRPEFTCKIRFISFYFIVHLLVCICVYQVHICCLQRPEEEFAFLETEVRDGCRICHGNAEKWTLVLCKISKCSSALSHLSSSKMDWFYLDAMLRLLFAYLKRGYSTFEKNPDGNHLLKTNLCI